MATDAELKDKIRRLEAQNEMLKMEMKAYTGDTGILYAAVCRAYTLLTKAPQDIQAAIDKLYEAREKSDTVYQQLHNDRTSLRRQHVERRKRTKAREGRG